MPRIVSDLAAPEAPGMLGDGLAVLADDDPIGVGRQATSGEVKGLRQEMRDLKELVAELSLENRLLKKNMIGHGGGEE